MKVIDPGMSLFVRPPQPVGLLHSMETPVSATSTAHGTAKVHISHNLPSPRCARLVLLIALLAALGTGGPRLQAQLVNGVGLKVLGKRPPDPPPVAGRPLETRPPNGAGQQPAFPGQTRVPAVLTRTPYKSEVMTRGLHKPWGMAFLPGGKILLTEKPGSMRIVDMKTGKIERQVLGVPRVLYVGDAGLLDITADPNFANNRRIYFAYVEPRGPLYKDPQLPIPQQENGVVIARARLSPDNTRLQNLTTLLRVEPSIPQTAHYGSRLLFDKQGYLFVSLGERFFYPTRGEAQSLFSYMGKILRIDTDGHPAPGNPFDEGKNWENFTLPEIWSYGHRNPEGLAINPQTGELWDSEHGPQGGDEINLVQRGKNYGWPLIAYGTNYDGTRIDGTLQKQDGVWRGATGLPAPHSTGLTAMPGLEQPVYYWDPAIAPSGISFYDGRLIPEWKGNLFVAALAGQHVARLVLQNNKVVGEERLLLDQSQRMRDIQEGPDGALWVITDEEQGRLIRIAPK